MQHLARGQTNPQRFLTTLSRPGQRRLVQINLRMRHQKWRPFVTAI